MSKIMCVLTEYFNSTHFLYVSLHVLTVCLRLMYTDNPTMISRLIHLFGTTEEVFNWARNWTHADVT